MRDAISFDRGTRTFVYGEQPCSWCGDDRWGVGVGRAVEFRGKACEKCKGTAKRGSGRCRACKPEMWMGKRYGRGQVADHDAPYDDGDCRACKGKGVEMASRTDTLPPEVIAAVLDVAPIRLYGGEREQSWGEQYLGVIAGMPSGMPLPLWSSVDYGASAAEVAADREAFIATMRAKIAADRIQACKLSTDDDLVVDHIGVFLARGGYSVQGIPAGALGTIP